MEKEEAINKQAYETAEALEKYSTYQLSDVEKMLFTKYYKPGESVLDLACGGGRTTVRLHELGLKVKGIDLSSPLIQMAQKRFPYISFETGSYCDIRESDESTDHVLISHNGLDYAFPETEREKAIAEAYRVLKPGGTFILSSHNIKSLYLSPYYFLHFKRMLWKVRNTLNAFKQKAYIQDLGMYTFFGSPSYIVRQIEKYGFQSSEIIGFRQSHNMWFNCYVSPYIHYVFQKPPTVPQK